MDKETLIEQLKANGKLISNEDHAFGYFAAITNIEQSLKGYAIVPEEPTFQMLEGMWGEFNHGKPEIDAATEAYKDMLQASKERE